MVDPQPRQRSADPYKWRKRCTPRRRITARNNRRYLVSIPIFIMPLSDFLFWV